MSDNYKSYYLNVSTVHLRVPRKRHFCRIELPDSLTDDEAVERSREIARRFGDAFDLLLQRMDRVGHIIDF